jgi:hypothetical protein
MTTVQFIPDALAKYTEYIKNCFKKLVTDEQYKVYGLKETDLDTLKPAYTKFVDAELAASNPATANATLRRVRDEARKELTKIWRAFVNEHIRFNHLVPTEDLEFYGIKAHDNTHTPIGIPEEKCTVTAVRRGLYEYDLHVEEESTGKAKLPHNAAGSFTYVTVTELGVTPHMDDFRKHDYSTTPHHLITFKDTEAGKQAHVFARYANIHGKEGPTGSIVTFIIG